MEVRNVAIIAHVDHGKTTLVNQLLINSHTFRENEKVVDRALDSNAIERERGITILAKTTAVVYKNVKINILDTPGHADFGGEVERIMNMVDGCILVVDAFEGTMPQTRFVLKKALSAGVKPIVVINKIDRPNAEPERVVDEILELFMDLGASEDMLLFEPIYCSALRGTSSLSPKLEDQKPGMDLIFEAIINNIDAPQVEEDKPLQMQPALIDYSDYIGKIGIGLVKRGKISINQTVAVNKIDGTIKQYRIQKLYGFLGLNRVEIEEAEAGEIVAVAGIADLNIGETLCDPTCIDPLPLLKIDPPTLEMTFGVNTSPFAGQDGKLLTVTKIQDRLLKETQRDVSLKVERVGISESFRVCGRGELHLSILIENMRREGFEIQVSKPQVIIKEIDGVKCEPFEDVLIDVPQDYMGSVIESLSNRSGALQKMSYIKNQVRLEYIVPSRGLLGFVNNFMTMTKGYGIINHTFREYKPMLKMSVGERNVGVIVASEGGQTTPYAIEHAEDRGVLFISPGSQVYEGMIVGENKYNNDLEVTVVKEKEKTNQRSASKDTTVVLKAPRKMSLEECLDYINTDELLEITPHFYRMRKRILNTAERKKANAKILRSQNE